MNGWRDDRHHPERLDDVGTTLTERELEVLTLIAQGASNREIAGELYLSADTVKTHVRKVFAKLGVSNRTPAALVASSHGLQLAATIRHR